MGAERVFPQDLDLAPLPPARRKVVAVLAFLCEEMAELGRAAPPLFYAKLAVFGRAPRGAGEESEVARPGDAEEAIGRLLPLLQDLSNFVDRCYGVAVNCVQQLSASCGGGRAPSPAPSPAPAPAPSPAPRRAPPPPSPSTPASAGSWRCSPR